jgi:hypothetical protein
LLGVNTTLNKLAVKLELSWHALRDFDSINRTADALEKEDSREVKMTKGENNEDLMMAILYRGMPSRRGGCVDVVPVLPTLDREVVFDSPPSELSHPMYP